MGDNSAQDKLIEQFVRHLSQLRNCELQIIEVPDKINRNEKEIDALIEGPRYRIALEHTSIDPLPRLRQEDSKKKEYILPVEQRLEKSFPGRSEVIVPYSFLKKGENFERVMKLLESWLVDNYHLAESGVSYSIPGLTFEVIINKQPNFPYQKLVIGSYDDPQRRPQVVSLLRTKLEKLNLEKYRDCEKILMVECSDKFVMNVPLIRKMVSDALSMIQDPHPDSIWFAHSFQGHADFYEITECRPEPTGDQKIITDS